MISYSSYIVEFSGWVEGTYHNGSTIGIGDGDVRTFEEDLKNSST